MSRTTDISFMVRGSTVAGVLREPAPAPAPAPPLTPAQPLAPGIVLTGPFTGVKEQVVATYAQALTAAGYVTLVFDHRNFGASAGEPRQHEDSAGKLEDLLAATSALAEHPGVDAERIGCVGICLGGGYALRHTAFDPRVKVAAFVAAAFNDPRAMRSGMGEEGYRAQLRHFAAVAQEQLRNGVVEYLPAVDEQGGPAAMPGHEPWEYYGTPRSAAERWENRVTTLSVRELITFDAAIGADFLGGTPVLFVHGRKDDFCSPELAASTYERAQSADKKMVWLDTSNHIDLYDNPAFVDPAVAELVEWFGARL